MIFLTPGRRRRLGKLRRIRASCRALVSSGLGCFGRSQLLLRWNDSCCLTAGTVQPALLTDSLVQCLTMAIKFILKIKLWQNNFELLIESVFLQQLEFSSIQCCTRTPSLWRIFGLDTLAHFERFRFPQFTALNKLPDRQKETIIQTLCTIR
jgi:hypothetical protein